MQKDNSPIESDHTHEGDGINDQTVRVTHRPPIAQIHCMIYNIVCKPLKREVSPGSLICWKPVESGKIKRYPEKVHVVESERSRVDFKETDEG